MKVFFKILISLILILNSLKLFSQEIKSFPSDSIKYFNTVKELMINADKKKGKTIIKEFETIWYGGHFSNKQREWIYSLSNIMISSGFKTYPDFYNFLTTLINFVKGGYNEQAFKKWQEIVARILKLKDKKALSRFLQFSSNLFLYNYIYNSPTTRWKISSKQFYFDFDSLPKLVFPAGNLICYSKNDSSVIYNTSGIFYPTENLWKGKGGKITWIRAAFSPDSVFAYLNKYKIKVESYKFDADSVSFYNFYYFNKPLLGKIKEKVLANINPQNASYPRFESYSKRWKINNLAENVDYDGGFKMYGAKFIGFGEEGQDAKIIFKKDNKNFLIAYSKTFIIRPDRISSDQAAVKIYLDNDSIYHPGLNFKYLIKKKLLSLYRDGKGLSNAPYYNSYHKIAMDFELLKWKTNEPFILFDRLPGSSNTSAHFESENYFKKIKFDAIQRLDPINPLIIIKTLSLKLKRKEIELIELADYMKKDPQSVSLLLMELANQGFIMYDFENKKFIIKDKLIHYVLSSAGKSDYDVIEFNSKVPTTMPNAKLNLLNNELDIYGLKNILLSDSQKVVIFPDSQIIKMKKNRDFYFSGILLAGRMAFYGYNYYFDYDAFKIKMPNVDSMQLYVQKEEIDDYGRKKIQRVKTVIQGIKGELFIDHPNNKSGWKNYPQYPIITTSEESYVFYDKKSIQNGVYNKDKFYFKVEPFTIDSLDNFDPKSIKLQGTFVSSDIFPIFDEKLTLQDDYSLGFIRSTPPEGYPIYGGKGMFYDKIKLSHKGLQGDGKFEYLTSTSYSNSFLFFPDSMKAVAQNFTNQLQQTGVEYPDVNAKNVKLFWDPKNDKLIVSKIDQALSMYKNEAKLHGSITLSPESMTGTGNIKFQRASMNAKLYDFKSEEFFSDTADFQLQTLENISELSFETNNVKAHLSFKERKGEFVRNGEGSLIHFPQNQYICYMDKFTWYMDNDDIALSSTKKETVSAGAKDIQLEGAKFISVNPKQDSLTFFSPNAKYDVRKNIIFAEGVKFINVADALIYPDSGKIVIEKKAKMQTLKNAVIIANMITQFHKIYEANVDIFGKKNYSASGNIDYIDENNNKFTIYLSNISVDTTGQTYGKGKIPEDEKFFLSKWYEFKGEVELYANNEFLIFVGTTKLQHGCSSIPLNWIKFKAEINPKDIFIPIDTNIKNINDKKIIASLLMQIDSSDLYSAFLNTPLNVRDKILLPAYGFLHFNKNKSIYEIATKEKINEMNLPGNYISINVKSCRLKGEGILNYGVNLGQVSNFATGEFSHDLKDNQIIFDLFSIIDFYFVNDALDYLANKIKANTSLEAVKIDRPIYEKALSYLMGKNIADKLISQIHLYGEFKKIPSELNKTFVFSQLRLKWDKKSHSYKSFGKIGISNIYKNQINKFVNGKIQIIKKRTGDIINIYLEIDPNNWYFFSYTRGLMQAVSSDINFNNIIKEVKADKRKLQQKKEKKGKEPYKFMLSTERKKNDFLLNFGQ